MHKEGRPGATPWLQVYNRGPVHLRCRECNREQGAALAFRNGSLDVGDRDLARRERVAQWDSAVRVTVVPATAAVRRGDREWEWVVCLGRVVEWVEAASAVRACRAGL